MKAIIALILLTLVSFQVEAKSGVSLNEAVNQVKSQGRVLSAKTINGQHEIKILTSSGAVKTINKKAAGRSNTKTNRKNTSNHNPQASRNQYRESVAPSRFQSSQNVMKLRKPQTRSRRAAEFKGNNANRRNKMQRAPNRNKNSTQSKDKDK